MYRTLQNLQQKPEAYRQKLVFTCSIAIILIIGSIWAITFSYRLERDVVANLDYSPTVDPTDTSLVVDKSSISPFTTLKNSLANAFNFARNQGSASAVLSEISEVDLRSGNTEPDFETTVELDFLSKPTLDFLE